MLYISGDSHISPISSELMHGCFCLYGSFYDLTDPAISPASKEWSNLVHGRLVVLLCLFLESCRHVCMWTMTMCSVSNFLKFLFVRPFLDKQSWDHIDWAFYYLFWFSIKCGVVRWWPWFDFHSMHWPAFGGVWINLFNNWFWCW